MRTPLGLPVEPEPLEHLLGHSIEDDLLHGRDLPSAMDVPRIPPSSATRSFPKGPNLPVSQSDLSLTGMERLTILRALEFTGGSLGETAKRLHIGRTTLYRKIREYRINQK